GVPAARGGELADGALGDGQVGPAQFGGVGIRFVVGRRRRRGGRGGRRRRRGGGRGRLAGDLRRDGGGGRLVPVAQHDHAGGDRHDGRQRRPGLDEQAAVLPVGLGGELGRVEDRGVAGARLRRRGGRRGRRGHGGARPGDG